MTGILVAESPLAGESDLKNQACTEMFITMENTMTMTKFEKKVLFATALVAVFSFSLSPLSAEEVHEHQDHPTGHSHSMHGDKHMKHMLHMAEVKKMLEAKLGKDYSKPLPPFTEGNRKRGKEIFKTTCSPCHGAEGRGDGPAAAALPMPPADFTDKMHAGFYSPRGRLWIIRNGSPGTPMVGWLPTLGEQGSLDVLSYIETLRDGNKAGGSARN